MAQNQEQIEARLCAYIDGELDATERAEIEKHLESNPQHRQLIKELMAQRDLLHALPREKAPAEIVETIQGQLERSVLLGAPGDGGDMQSTRMSQWSHRGAIAAIVLLAAGLGVLVYKVLPSNKPPAEFAVAPKETGPVPATLQTEETPDASKQLSLAEKTTPAAPTSISPTVAPPAAVPSIEAAASPPATAPITIAEAAPDQQNKTTEANGGALAMTPGAVSNAPSVVNAPLLNAMNRSDGSDTKLSATEPAPETVSNGSISIIVSTDDVAFADEQVRAFLNANAIAWAPAPQAIPIDSRDSEVAAGLRKDESQSLAFRSSLATTQPTESSLAKAEPTTTNSIPNDSVVYLKSQSIAPQSISSQSAAQLQSPAPAQNVANSIQAPSTQMDIASANAAPTAPATQPVDQPLADARIGTLSFMCRDVTVEQAHELADMLSAKPGQTARVVEQQSQVAALGVERAAAGFGGGGGFGGRGGGFGAAAGAVGTNESGAMGTLAITPSSQPATGPSISLGQSPTTQSIDRIETDADKSNLQQQQITLSIPATQPQSQRVDLLILLCPQVAATTQPATQPADQAAPANVP
jgi:Putative zinc-finger